jgi:soluble lytic murein transglycosylase
MVDRTLTPAPVAAAQSPKSASSPWRRGRWLVVLLPVLAAGAAADPTMFLPPASGSAAATSTAGLDRGPATPAAATSPPAGEVLRPLDPAPFAAAAAALRAGDLAAAWQAASAAAERNGSAAEQLRFVLGLFAHARGDAERALVSLAAPAADARFEDWRLLVLAEAARSRGRLDTASAAIDRLLAGFPASPLRGRALRHGAELAAASGDLLRAASLVDRARQEDLGGADAIALESLAWQLAGSDPKSPAAREAARRLLTAAPVAAAELGLEARFGGTSQAPGWRQLLSTSDLLARAEAFLAAERNGDARQTLSLIPEAERGLAWTLLEARALTAMHFGAQALARLASAQAVTPREQAQVAWARAEAAADLAVAVRGRQNLPASGRLQKQREANEELKIVAALEADPELTVRALRELFVNLADDNLFEPALAALRRLRALDPADTTGARYLWEVGWQEFGRSNYSGAIGNWTVLDELYPQTVDAYRGRYWKARAFEALGDAVRARTLLTELVENTDTSDFYRRQALARLGRAAGLGPGLASATTPGPSAAPEALADEPWQLDPLFLRARTFLALGLDGLATDELAAIGQRGNPRDRATLEGLLLAHRGERVEAIRKLRAAWPALATSAQAGVPLEVREAYYPFDYGEILARHAERTGLPVHLLAGVIRQESAFNPKAKSRAGARGLMQLMPTTGKEVARRLGIPYSLTGLYDPETSVALGSTYLDGVIDGFDGNLELALAGYNGGPGRIRRLWNAAGHRDLDLFLEQLPIEESKTYVKRVLVLADSYRQLLARQPAAPAG